MQIRFRLIITPLFFLFSATAQISATDPEFEAVPVNGNDQVDWILQTQFTLPKNTLTGGFDTESLLFFNIDSTGTAYNFKEEKNE